MTGRPRVAVVGAGPAGFYAVEALCRQRDDVRVDLFERLPAPFGLVRYGVAPDHPKLKTVTRVFERIAADERVRFIGNVQLGRDVHIVELRQHYHAVVIACGLGAGRRPGIPGEHLPGCCTAAELVGWYNSHPDHQQHRFNLSGQSVIIIGNGNVALDVARLVCKPNESLAQTDIAREALTALASSGVTDVHVVGRRGPLEASFTAKELREFTTIDGCTAHVLERDLAACSESASTLDAKSEAALKFALLEGWRCGPNGSTAGSGRRCHFRFHLAPAAIGPSDRGKGMAVTFLDALAGNRPMSIDAGLVVFSVGYEGDGGGALTGLPLDETRGTLRHDGGRVQPGVYASGWIKRGPTGVIGSNRADSVATVANLLEDLPTLPAPYEKADLETRLRGRGVRTVSFDEWSRIALAEAAHGEAAGCAPLKFTSVDAMLAHLCDGALGRLPHD